MEKCLSYNSCIWKNAYPRAFLQVFYAWNCTKLYEKHFSMYQNYLASIFGQPGISETFFIVIRCQIV